MYLKILNYVKAKDDFAFKPNQAITFNGKGAFTTFPGAVWSILLSLFYYWLWYTNFYDMFFYKQNAI